VAGHEDHRDQSKEIGDHYEKSTAVLDGPLETDFMICGSQKLKV